MRISLSDIPIICLTCEEDGDKRRHMQAQCNPIFVMPILGIQKNKSGASGFFRMIEQGLRMQSPNTPFRPFLLLEDDVIFTQFSDVNHFDIPDNTDILYVGLSICSIDSYRVHYANYYESIDEFPNVVRVKHMLASHGIMVCSPLGASVLQRTMLETFLSDKAWDVPLAFLQPYYNVYAFRLPWVYQDIRFGGDEACTRITLEGPDNPMPDEWISKDLATIKML